MELEKETGEVECSLGMARLILGELADRAHYGRGCVILTRHGKPWAKIVALDTDDAPAG